MKILFFVEATGRIRYFDSVVRMLAERGHTIRVAARPKKGELRLPAALEHPSISVVECPRRRADDWSDLAGFLRTARDYARYLAPRFRGAVALRGRLRGPVADTFLRFCQEHTWVQRHWKVLTLALKLAEDLIPSDEAFERFLESEHPDIVLITPLVDFIVYPTDYVKSAHKLGLPIAYLLWSWDNLTSKGMIRVIPDRALVWNQIQKWEAVRLHGVPADRVVVTGAPRFDRFFTLRPATTRVEFCEQNGLDPARSFILYLGSSDFVGHRELEFVRRWVAEIRRSPDPVLRTCGLLIRPHPATKKPWRREDLPDLPNVSLQRLGLEGRERSLYDALHHAAAVVGRNTSALIEAGIVGKAVYTVVVPEFAQGQEGTLHFDYLLRANGGLVSPARSFPEHCEQLSAALASGSSRREESLKFVERFVRPHGLDQPVTPLMVREIERLAEMRKRPQSTTPLWHHPLRAALRFWLRRWMVAQGIVPHPNRPLPNLRLRAGARPPAGKKSDRLGATKAAAGRKSRSDAARPDKVARKGVAPVTRRETAAGLDGVIDKALLHLAATRGKRLQNGRSAEWSSALFASLPEQERIRFYSSFDLMGRMDYARHDIYLKLSSEFIQRRLTSAKKEPFTVNWIERSLKPGDVFYDIGANVGPYSLIAAKVTAGRARTFAFEPSPETFADLCWNVAANDCVESITPLPIALWSENSVAAFTYHAAASGAAGHRLRAAAAASGSEAAKPILTFRLDDLIRQLGMPAPNLIKVDVDGAELDVLRGATETLRDARCRSLIVEVDDRVVAEKVEVYQTLEAVGFKLQSEHRRKEGAPLYSVFSKA